MDDVVGDGEPKPQALPDILGREERIEYRAVDLLVNPRAFVQYIDPDDIIICGNLDEDVLAAGLDIRVDRI